MVVNLKLLLVGFENLSGLKINYEKSEMIALNISNVKAQNLAIIFGCKISTLPITYLGVLLHWKRLSTSD